MQRLVLFVGILFASFASSDATGQSGADTAADSAAHVSQKFPIVIELERPAATLQRTLESPLVDGLLALDGGGEAIENRAAVVEVVRTLEPVMRRRMVVGVAPRATAPAWLAVLQVSHDVTLTDIVERLKTAGLDPGVEPIRRVDDTDWRSIGNLGLLAHRGDFVFWSSERIVLRKALKLARKDSVSAEDAFRAARSRGAGQDFVARLRLDGAFAATLFPTPKDLAQLLLVEPIVAEFRSAGTLLATGKVGPSFDLQIASFANGRAAVVPIAPETAGIATSLCGRIRIRRSLHDLFARRLTDGFNDDIRRELNELAQLVTQITGRSAESLFAQIDEDIDVLVGPAEPRSDDKPSVLYPSFAVCFSTRFTDDDRARLRIAFQSLIGLSNFEADNENRPRLIQFTHRVGNHVVDAARYLADVRDGTTRPIYNFSPCMTFIGRRLVIASSVPFIERVIRTPALHMPPATTATTNTKEEVLAFGPAIARILRRNVKVLADRSLLSSATADARSARARMEDLARKLDRMARLRLIRDARDGGSGLRLSLTNDKTAGGGGR